jgi:long-chain acyl-CoA synthetase
MNYRVLKKHTDSLATSLAKQGIKKGDVIAILIPNSFQFTISYFATVKLGAIATLINPTYKPLEILNVLKQVNAKALICMDAMYGLIKPIKRGSCGNSPSYKRTNDWRWNYSKWRSSRCSKVH